MSDLTEDAIEQNLIDLLQQQGYTCFNDSAIAPNSDNPQRDAFDSVVLENQFKASLKKLNPDLPESARHEAFQHVLHLGTNDIMTNNEKFHQMLCDGVTVEYFKVGQSVGLQVKLIDFENIQNNNFWAVNQFVIKENNQSKRLDVILFVNGLPLVVVELKNATSEKATMERAYTQIQNYKTAIPSIFNYNALCIISDGIDARVSTLSAPYSRFLAWKAPRPPEGGEGRVSVLRSAEPRLYGMLKEKALSMRNKPTAAEAVLWQALKGKQLGVKFRQQHIVDRFIVDFCSLELQLIIEVDGEIHDRQEQADQERTKILELSGYRIIRFTNQEVSKNLDAVLQKIQQYIVKSPLGDLGAGILPELQVMTERMFKPEVLLKLIRFNTVFESEEIKNENTGVLSLVKIKKVAAYHQYYVVEKAVQSTLRAIKTAKQKVAEDPAVYGLKSVQNQPEGDRKIGVVWHTQGSGKSLSMVFYAGRLVVEPAMQNPTIVILTDRNDLDDQLFATFSNCVSLLRQTPVQANNRAHLKELLTVTGGGIVFTTIQKFYPDDGSGVFDALSERANIVVVADEAHRSQYGFTGKVDKEGNIKYGNVTWSNGFVQPS